MEVYLVGGAVRDTLMGLEPKDKDYVVVGSTPEKMLELGYKQVGCDFPVFLHPVTGDEYALARTEVKNGNGYQRFDCHFGPEVTLEEDLLRRDLTINAMAMAEDGTIIDPFGGREDLSLKVLKHTSEAFEEDPVRVLRTLRLLSRYGKEWDIHIGTLNFCYWVIVQQFKDLTPERVFLELNKVLSENSPELFFECLEGLSEDYWFKEYEALCHIPQKKDYHPEIWTGLHTRMCLSQGVKLGLTQEEQFAVLCHDFGKAPCYKERGNLHGHEEAGVPLVNNFCDRLKVPASYRELALKVCKFHTHAHKSFDMKPSTVMRLFESLDCIRKPHILESFLKCCEADARGRLGFEDKPYPQREFLTTCFKAIQGVDTKSIAKELTDKGKEGTVIGKVIRQERIAKIKQEKKKWKISGTTY